MNEVKLEITEDNFNNLSIEEAKFIFEQSDKFLKDKVETSQVIVARTTTLLTLIIGIIIGLISYSITIWQKNCVLSPDIITALGISLYSFVICFFLIRNISPKNYLISGREPSRIITNEFFTASDEKIRILWIYLSEIKANQFKIDKNEEVNNKRWHVFKMCLWLITSLPFVLFILYVVVFLCC